MSEHALKIIGFDEETHRPVHIALTLVTSERGRTAPSSASAFAAPRGFLGEDARQGLLRPDAMVDDLPAFAAPRGFIPAL